MYSVRKRNGNLVAFSAEKIINAIRKAFDATGTDYTDEVLSMLALQVTSSFQSKIQNGAISVEDIQDSVESVLGQTGYHEVAKSYIIYRRNHEAQRNMKSAVLDYQKVVDGYLKLNDWRVKENSTVQYSLGGLILSNSGAVTANYWLSQVYDKETADAHRNCDFHIHDLSMLAPYCAGWSLKQLIQEGLGGVEGKITSLPASHLMTLCNQMVNFLGILQNEWAGAQAFSSFDTYLAPFVKADNLSYREVKQAIQAFVFGNNTPSRWGTQAPFTNITLDWVCPNDLKNLPAIVGGKEMPYTYGDCQKEMDMVNKAFLEIMIEGDANGRGFQYPIPTYSITRDFDWSDTENNRLLFEMTAKYGTPYFSNYINSDMEPSDVRSMCPLAASEQVLVYDDYTREFHISNIKSLWKSQEEKHAKRKTFILHDGKLKEARLNKFIVQQIYEVELINGHKIRLSDNHTNLTAEGLKRTDELTTSDYLPFNTVPYRNGIGLTYNEGYLVGAFLGDGCYKDERSISYCLNETSKLSVLERIRRIVENMGAKTSRNKTNGIGVEGSTILEVNSLYIKGLIQEFVIGRNALEKGLNLRALGKSLEFRKGIAAGLYDTDGGNHNRIYSSSRKMIDSIAALFTSLGINTRVDVDKRDSEKKLSDNPVYCIRFYEEDGVPCRKDTFFRKDGYMWFRIKNIRKVPGNLAFCFEVLNDETPYFTMPSGLVTHNCRLRLDLRELRKKSGGYFGSGESTGSIGVVTLNMPRLAYLAKDEADFWKRLDRLMDIAAKSLKVKREFVTKLLEEGLYPYTKRYLGTFNSHFSTIGLVGMNECCLNANWIRADLTDSKAQDFTEKVLNHMRERLSDYQEKYGDLYNLEATPAESTTYRFAKHDREQFPDIITASENDDAPYYTNSSHLPVGFTDDIFSALDIQDRFQTLYTSGTVFHAFLGEKMPNWQSAARLVRKIAENYRLPYFTLSPTYSVCPDHGYITGEQWKCPICGKPTEVYSRITGYYRPVKNWNVGKSEEFRERKTYDIGNSHLRHSGPEAPQGDDAAKHDEEKAKETAPILLFTTKTCPNCRIAKAKLDDAGIAYTVIDAEEHPELTSEYGISQAPTLIADGKACRGLSEILGFIRG